MQWRRTLAAVCFTLFALSGGFRAAAAAGDKVAALQALFDRATYSVEKAKLLGKLGDAQFAEAHRAGERNDYQTVGLLMEKYRDNVRAALVALEVEHSDAEKRPAGYRNLEIQVRHSLRDLEETLLLAPPEYRPPLSLVRTDLEEMHEELLRALFPRRPGEKPIPKPGKPQKPN